MRARPRSSTIAFVFVHPDIHREITRQRQQGLPTGADRQRLVRKARRRGRRLDGPAAQIERVGTQGEMDVALRTAWIEREGKVLAANTHFGHRETGGIVVDLFWDRGNQTEFHVEVEDRRDGTRFVLYPTSGRDAIQAFYHPFAAARRALNGKGYAA